MSQNYFSHDSNARNSKKIINLRMKLRAEGYGVYFMLLERLREEENYKSVKDYNMLAFDLRVDTSIIKSVVEEFGLFVFTDDGKYFYSEGFNDRMSIKDEKTKKLKEAGIRGSNKRWGKESLQEKDSHPITTLQEKDSNIIKLNLIKDISIEITREDRERIFNIFFFKNYENPRGEVEKFINHYQSQGWRKKTGAEITDVVALSESWKSEQDKRLPTKFLAMWQEMYDKLKDTHMLSPFDVKIKDENMCVNASEALKEAIEANTDICAPIFKKYFKNLLWEWSTKK